MNTMMHLLLLSLIRINVSSCYAHHSDIDRKCIAGLWRLTNEKSVLPSSSSQLKFPMKEFTVYPKKKVEPNDTLLLLKDDGSFLQYEGLMEKKRHVEVDRINSVAGLAFLKGTWEYLDGKLILATDRPKDVDPRKVHDTILSGRVVFNDNLSVPKGSIKVGKFMYPKRHPSFFDQLLIQPTKTGSFSLRQVLGSYTQSTPPVEKYQPKQFFDKQFLLTSFPIPAYKPKKDLKWSKLQRKYIQDEPVEDVIDIRVMKIKFFSNYTFATINKPWNQKLLRGKWNIIGEEKDHLWFQVCRFGFGRSVSGSTYSEGQALTQDDARIYWGSIAQNHIYSNKTNTTVLEVSGTVLIGAGLEPLPIGKFTMVEITNDDDEDSDEDNQTDNYLNDTFQ